MLNSIEVTRAAHDSYIQHSIRRVLYDMSHKVVVMMLTELTVDCSPMITQCPSASACFASLTAAGTFSMVLHMINTARHRVSKQDARSVIVSNARWAMTASCMSLENVDGEDNKRTM
jgi:hypothetical protein